MREGRSPSPSAPPTSAACVSLRAASPRSTSRPSARRRRSRLKLLYEIGCEELPAGSVYEAEAQLPALAERHLGVGPERLFVGPRRLAILVSGLEERTGDQWVKGPPVALR